MVNLLTCVELHTYYVPLWLLNRLKIIQLLARVVHSAPPFVQRPYYYMQNKSERKHSMHIEFTYNSTVLFPVQTRGC